MKIDMDEVYSQQDDATCHTSNASIKETESYFEKPVTAKITRFTEGPRIQQ
jgi:hypothetical protein